MRNAMLLLCALTTSGLQRSKLGRSLQAARRGRLGVLSR